MEGWSTLQQPATDFNHQISDVHLLFRFEVVVYVHDATLKTKIELVHVWRNDVNISN